MKKELINTKFFINSTIIVEFERICKQRKLHYVQIYSKAGFSRQSYSYVKKTLSDPSYKFKRNLAINLGLALNLNFDEMNNFLSFGGFCLSENFVYDREVIKSINPKYKFSSSDRVGAIDVFEEFCKNKNSKHTIIYKKALLSKSNYSRIKKNCREKLNYQIERSKAILLAFALELDEEKMKSFLSEMGYHLSEHSDFDKYVLERVRTKNYDFEFLL